MLLTLLLSLGGAAHAQSCWTDDPPGGGPQRIRCGFNYLDVTDSFDDAYDYDASCTSLDYPGSDVSWAFDSTVDQRVMIYMEHETGGPDFDMMALGDDNCGAGATCLDWSAGTETPEFVTWMGDGGTDYLNIDEFWGYGGAAIDVRVGCSGLCDPVGDVKEPLTCSTDITSDTNSGTSDVLDYYYCGGNAGPFDPWPQEGPEAIYTFEPQQDGDVTFELTNLSIDHDIYILEDSCDPAACIAGSTELGTADDTVPFTAEAGKTYYIVIEAYGGTGNYDLSFVTTDNSGCQEDCNDSLDNDDDGLIDCADVDDCGTDPFCFCDQDGDGHDKTSGDSGGVCDGDDCDDADEDISPSASEVCNGVDDDCANGVDDGVLNTYYEDSDGDGYGTSATTTACTTPSGYADVDGDCDDGDGDVNPAASEVCNGVDDDCANGIDDGIVDRDWFDDSDGDGFGDTLTGNDCRAPNAGDVDVDGDCNDSNAAINPGETEICNGVDDDCAGGVDDGLVFADYWLDSDSDGYGDGSVDNRCDTPSYPNASVDGDCDDGDAAINPGESEVCNGIDDDCANGVDDGIAFTDYYEDADGDGYGDESASASSECTNPGGGWSTSNDDCDDTDDSINPGEVEACNGIDDDCVGGADDGLTFTDWFRDADSDGYGAGSATNDCVAPSGGWVDRDGDCKDGNAAINPGETEVCNGVDDDCVGGIDDGLATSTWYADVDGDTYGDAGDAVDDCRQPTGFVADDADCDDTNEDINPVAQEICNAVDDDCDGDIDTDDPTLDPTQVGVWYADADADGFGDASVSTESCDAVPDHVLNKTDCDDGEAAVNPAADEVCNGIDDDCDGDIDSADDSVDLSTGTTYFADADGDGFGTAGSSVDSCDQPSGFVSDDTDCDDGSALRQPSGLAETCDGIDNDCDFVIDNGTECFDDDGDGYTENGGDCDDADTSLRPGAIELEDGIDQDCDGIVDEGTDAYDDDLDGFSENDGDCNDADRSVSPGVAEVDANGIDDDCDGGVDGGAFDPDGDGYSETGGDCDEGDANTHPGAPERIDGIDNDCDGEIDEGTTAYDDDGDGVSEAEGDCNDDDASVHPGALDVANGIDDDCSGVVDDGTDRTDDDGDGFSEEEGDCDDADDQVHPGAEELANSVDDDCDGQINEGFSDLDGDGYGDDDCNDASPWVNPGLPEMCGDGLDNDCDGRVDNDCDGSSLGTDTGLGSAGCTCASDGGSAGLLPVLLGGLLLLRRRNAEVAR